MRAYTAALLLAFAGVAWVAPTHMRLTASRSPASCRPAWQRTAFPALQHGSISAFAAVSARDVWAVGAVGIGNVRGLTAHWDGTRWRIVPSPRGWMEIRDVVANRHDDVWAVGYSGDGVILHWQGTSWQRVRAPGLAEASLFGVGASAPDDVWAVGIDGDLRPLVLHWNGRSWRRVPAPVLPGLTESEGLIQTSRLTGVAAVSKRDAWLVGEQPGEHGFDKLPVIAHWDGREWSLVETPRVDGILERLAIASATDVWAVGGGPTNTVVHWNGVDWQVHELPWFFPQLGDVAAAGPRDVWLAGPLGHWNGSVWRRATGFPDSWLLFTVETVSPTDVWAGGLVGFPAKVRVPLVLRYSCVAR